MWSVKRGFSTAKLIMSDAIMDHQLDRHVSTLQALSAQSCFFRAVLFENLVEAAMGKFFGSSNGKPIKEVWPSLEKTCVADVHFQLPLAAEKVMALRCSTLAGQKHLEMLDRDLNISLLKGEVNKLSANSFCRFKENSMSSNFFVTASLNGSELDESSTSNTTERAVFLFTTRLPADKNFRPCLIKNDVEAAMVTLEAFDLKVYTKRVLIFLIPNHGSYPSGNVTDYFANSQKTRKGEKDKDGPRWLKKYNKGIKNGNLDVVVLTDAEMNALFDGHLPALKNLSSGTV